MKRLEFSKWLMIISYTVMIIITGFAAYSFLLGHDIDALTPLIAASWTEVAAINAFYMSKAKAENKIKIVSHMSREDIEELNMIDNIFN